MSAKRDLQASVHAVISATPDAVADACRRAAKPLEHRSRLDVAGSTITLTIISKPYKFRTLTLESPVVGIALRTDDQGRLHVEAGVATYNTMQSKSLGIPTGPKMMIGGLAFRQFLDSLARELDTLDPDGSVVIS
jgi:hypothetical protein